jgi:tRNA A-37 threonylcarbamoyl transferase component Bud32
MNYKTTSSADCSTALERTLSACPWVPTILHSNGDDDSFDGVVQAFEAAWKSGNAPDIRMFTNSVPSASRAALLDELIRVDMECRWKRYAGDAEYGMSCSLSPWTIDDYLARHPELGDAASLHPDLILEEYRVRQRWGDRPESAEFARRFPGRESELLAALAKVDCELLKEVDPPAEAEVNSSAASNQFAKIPRFDYRDFVLEAHLGSGGIGKVYRAWWKSRKRQVAIKMMRKNWWRQPGADELFFREAEILVCLRHAHIVSVHGIGRTLAGGCFLVMELIDGGDLGQKANAAVPAAQAIDWVAQAAEGLAYAHNQGVVHRDLKPSNLLLDHAGRVFIADFGLALDLFSEDGRAESLVGTVAYMAPEQLFYGRAVGPAADVFGLGAVLHTLLFGRPPYEGHNLINVVRRRLAAPPRTPPRGNLPPAVETILARCLNADPDARITAKELAMVLRRLVSE